MPALLRMPLLYVDGRALQNVNLGGGGNGSVDTILEQVVYKAIRERWFMGTMVSYLAFHLVEQLCCGFPW